MDETEIIRHSQGYLQKLANGINPLTGETLPESDIVNNLRITKCLLYVSDRLDELVKLKEEISGSRYIAPGLKIRKMKKSFRIPDSKLKDFGFSEKVTLRELLDRINCLVDENEMKTLTAGKVNTWLLEQGYLEKKIGEGNTVLKCVTEKGRSFGLSQETFSSFYGERIVLYFSKYGQKLIVDNLPAISPSNDRYDFEITEEELKRYALIPNGPYISHIVAAINNIKSDPNMKKLTPMPITEWLLSNGYFSVKKDSYGKDVKTVTEKGKEVGISQKYVNGQYGSYLATCYDENAQSFIISSLIRILDDMQNE